MKIRDLTKNKPLIVIFSILVLLLFVALILTPVHKRAPEKKRIPVVKGRIAIVIDDWGYSLNNLAIIKEIKVPLTCAILPNLKNSKAVARQLNKLGFEIILHLPMEPKEKINLEKNTITSGMNEEQIRNILNADLNAVIFAKGINNHMGSRITEDSQISSVIMSEAKKHKLYFLDSFVTAKSICRQIAGKINIKFAKRDIFLDNQNDLVYIKEQLKKVKNLAAMRGSAIAIGHDRKNTLTVLKEMLPQLESEGYKFVFVSELVK
ncbi:MAG: hypothetical protein COV71_04765 [Candidatus Omnitrophica bacterium CG11_big_fil_rev_8_21_14_0_20_41_12]|nr:MAG: hypothetical protein COV71_04765 [Candidatus Omnitrophica bacterium CG11_big_fil_rev_8_21_14_0_20_41_12]